MSRYDARQLVDNIERLIAGTPLSSIPSPLLHAPDPAPDEAEGEGGECEGQSSMTQALNLSLLPSLREHQRVDKVPDGTRLAFPKKILMRLLRMVSGPQAAFNYFVCSALEVVAQHSDALRRRVAAMEGARRTEKADIEVKLAGLHQAVEVLETRMSEELLGLRAGVNVTLETVGGDIGRLESELNAMRSVVTTLESRIEQAWTHVEEYAGQNRQMTETVLKSSRDMVESIWKGLEERDVQLSNTTKGVQTCHLQINKLEHDTREAQARLLVINEQINIQLDALEKLRRHIESKRTEQLREGEALAAPPPVLPDAEARPSVSSPSTPSPLSGAASASSVGLPPPRPASSPESPFVSFDSHQVDLAYLRFQRQYRGDEAMLKESQRRYVDLILDTIPEGRSRARANDGAKIRLLDLACGDGFFLDLWREHPGMETHGVDISAAMVRLGRGTGLSLEQADAFAYLESGPEKAWDVITSFQFIEHLDKPELLRLVRGCKRALKPGGLLLFETLNPHSIISHKWFHFDLTHKRLVFPEMASLLMESVGIRVIETRTISEVHESEKLQLLGDARLQANFDRLNEFLFGNQDYYILAQRP